MRHNGGTPQAEAGEAAGASALRPRLVPGLSDELTAGGEWRYPWRLAAPVQAAAPPSARWLAWSFAAIVEGPARDALLLADEPRALLIGAGDGYLAHRLSDWGAERVLAVEGDERDRRRAGLIAGQMRVRSGLELSAELPGAGDRFDVVLVAPGAPPGPVLEAACAATGRVCAIATEGGETTETAERALAAGIAPIEIAAVPRHAHPLYVLGEREVLIGRRRDPSS